MSLFQNDPPRIISGQVEMFWKSHFHFTERKEVVTSYRMKLGMRFIFCDMEIMVGGGAPVQILDKRLRKSRASGQSA